MGKCKWTHKVILKSVNGDSKIWDQTSCTQFNVDFFPAEYRENIDLSWKKALSAFLRT